MGQEMSFNTFLDSAIQALTPLDGPSLAFPDVGDVHFTTLTTTNLALDK